MPHPLHHLQLAFAHRMAVELIGIDADVAPAELAFLLAAFPEDQLRSCGFVDDAGSTTPRYAEALEAARVALPDLLTIGEKLALVEIVASASAADGLLVAEEADALAAVARMLGVEDRQWLDHLEGLMAAGGLRRDDAGV